MSSDLSRRELFKVLGAAGLTVNLPESFKVFEADQDPEFPKIKFGDYPPIAKPVTAVVLGYGGRGGYYGWMATQFPNEWQITGVAEPIDYRREAATKRHNLPQDRVFTTWEHVFERPKFADAVVVSTQDAMHTKPALRAIEMGYDVLLEKPIAQSWKECQAIMRAAEKHGRIVAVCHVLRYAPYFMMMREIIRSGMIGEVVSIQHFEPVQHLHFSHSYCRGPWRNKKESNPIILAKSCHDLDILNFIVEKKVVRVSANGGLHFFQAKNAPAGAPKHCMDGCPVQSTCSYYAPDVYVHKGKWDTHHIVTRDRSKESILKELQKGQYGRCVYHCDNDVCDHMITLLDYKGGATASLHVEAMFGHHGRRTRVFASKGHIDGDMNQMEVFDFQRERALKWNTSMAGTDLGGHGGGDTRLVRDFCQAVSARDPGKLTSNLANSMESHLAGFLAEESRVKGGQPRRVG
jgi:predicted dehydrogenase